MLVLEHYPFLKTALLVTAYATTNSNLQQQAARIYVRSKGGIPTYKINSNPDINLITSWEMIFIFGPSFYVPLP